MGPLELCRGHIPERRQEAAVVVPRHPLERPELDVLEVRRRDLQDELAIAREPRPVPVHAERLNSWRDESIGMSCRRQIHRASRGCWIADDRSGVPPLPGATKLGMTADMVEFVLTIVRSASLIHSGPGPRTRCVAPTTSYPCSQRVPLLTGSRRTSPPPAAPTRAPPARRSWRPGPRAPAPVRRACLSQPVPRITRRREGCLLVGRSPPLSQGKQQALCKRHSPECGTRIVVRHAGRSRALRATWAAAWAWRRPDWETSSWNGRVGGNGGSVAAHAHVALVTEPHVQAALNALPNAARRRCC